MGYVRRLSRVGGMRGVALESGTLGRQGRHRLAATWRSGDDGSAEIRRKGRMSFWAGVFRFIVLLSKFDLFL